MHQNRCISRFRPVFISFVCLHPVFLTVPCIFNKHRVLSLWNGHFIRISLLCKQTLCKEAIWTESSHNVHARTWGLMWGSELKVAMLGLSPRFPLLNSVAYLCYSTCSFTCPVFIPTFFFHLHFWQNLGPVSSVWVLYG
jgi:hypothetical protein